MVYFRRMTHLLQPDADLLQQYFAEFPDRYNHIDFDVRVGGGRDPGEHMPDHIRHMAIQLSQRRIDAVAHRIDRIDIIEVTQTAGIKALGQLQAYPYLYFYTYFPTLEVKPVLVARKFSSDAEQLFMHHDIETHLYPG